MTKLSTKLGHKTGLQVERRGRYKLYMPYCACGWQGQKIRVLAGDSRVESMASNDAAGSIKAHERAVSR